jgi:predicted transcriptional regulator
MRRNDLQIQADLLTIADVGARKTELVYKGNLNFKIVKKYLRRLIDNGLLKETDGTFITTDEGRMFLTKFSELTRFGLS